MLDKVNWLWNKSFHQKKNLIFDLIPIWNKAFTSVKFWSYNFTICRILDRTFYNVSDSESKNLHDVWFSELKFKTRND